MLVNKLSYLCIEGCLGLFWRDLEGIVLVA